MISATAAAGTTPPAHSPSVWIDRLSKAPQGQDMRKVQGHAHVPHTHLFCPIVTSHTHTHTHTHTQLSAPLLLLLPRGSRKLFGYFFLESYYSWNISKETAPGCALLLWHWLGLFSLLGCSCDQMTESAHHCFPTMIKWQNQRITASLLKEREMRKEESRRCFHPSSTLSAFQFTSGFAAFASFV